MIKKDRISKRFLYSVLAVLFVNVSVGGAMTSFAAPPILMVARPWGWGSGEVFFHLGIPGLITILLNSFILIYWNRKEIPSSLTALDDDHYDLPAAVIFFNLIALAAVIFYAHRPEIFLPVIALFIIVSLFMKQHQDGLKFRESAMVSFFLYGLIVFGSLQSWWLSPLISEMGSKELFFGATGLTAVTDNAALTFLGSQVRSLSEISKWSLTSGALVGGGLTILANAPNAAGFAILRNKFPDETLNGFSLLKTAVVPTLVALAAFYFCLLF